MKHIKPINEYNDEHLDERMKLIMKDILNKMVPAAFGPSSNFKMRDEIKDAVKQAIEPILKKYDYIVESDEVNEGVIQNLDSAEFNGADPKTIEVHNQGVGGVHSLQGMRTHIVKLLEQMLKDAKMAEKNHELAHYSISKIQSIADPTKMGGVFLKYIENHQKAVEELENTRKRGGSGKGRTIPKGLI